VTLPGLLHARRYTTVQSIHSPSGDHYESSEIESFENAGHATQEQEALKLLAVAAKREKKLRNQTEKAAGANAASSKE
jgi:hypothetical protein